jgi:hypothetical protein
MLGSVEDISGSVLGSEEAASELLMVDVMTSLEDV